MPIECGKDVWQMLVPNIIIIIIIIKCTDIKGNYGGNFVSSWQLRMVVTSS